MAKKSGSEEIILFEENLQVPYRYSAGPTVSRFLNEIRDHERIVANRCRKCDLTYLPPRSVCPRCMDRPEDWVELAGTGTIESYTVVRYTEPIHPHPPPLYYALIRLDGADGGLVHLLGELTGEEIRAGMRVEPVFAAEKKGTILDIAYFRPVGHESGSP
jgi:uncharacterized OB-fold protein